MGRARQRAGGRTAADGDVTSMRLPRSVRDALHREGLRALNSGRLAFAEGVGLPTDGVVLWQVVRLLLAEADAHRAAAARQRGRRRAAAGEPAPGPDEGENAAPAKAPHTAEG